MKVFAMKEMWRCLWRPEEIDSSLPSEDEFPL